jgi:hypothetical protein
MVRMMRRSSKQISSAELKKASLLAERREWLKQERERAAQHEEKEEDGDE